jgi:hypothetical protein
MSYSNFPIIPSNLCEDPSLNTQEIKFPSLQSISRALLIGKDLPDLHTILVQSVLADGHSSSRKLHSFNVFILAFACNPIRNDHEVSSFSFNFFIVVHPQSSSVFENSICFQIPTKNFTLVVFQWP